MKVHASALLVTVCAGSTSAKKKKKRVGLGGGWWVTLRAKCTEGSLGSEWVFSGRET